MSIRRTAAAVATAALVALSVAVPAASAAPRATTKVLDFRVALQPAGDDSRDLPGGVSYGQSQLVGTTTWGRRAAVVDWMCSHVSTQGAGPSHDLVTITRADGAALALSIDGWVSSGVLRGTVSVIGGKGPYAGATGTGTVIGRTGEARLRLTVSQSRERTVARAWNAVGC